jgi:Virulence-associated protein E
VDIDEKLSIEEALAQVSETIPDDDNIAHLDKEATSEPETEALERNLDFINKLLKRIKVDSFNATPAAIADAKAHLQTPNVKNNIAVTNVCFDGSDRYKIETQFRYGELRVKCDEVYEEAKRHLQSAFTAWKADIKALEKTARIELYNSGKQYTAFNVPWPNLIDHDEHGKYRASPENAVAAIRHIYDRENIHLAYDLWKRQQVRIDIKTGKQIIDDYKNETVFVRELQNSIAEQYKLSFLEPTVKDAIGRLSVHNQFHSMKDQIRKLRDNWRDVGKSQWQELYPDQTPMDVLVTDIYKMEGSALNLAVMKKWLMASTMRVWIPGLKFDITPYWCSIEGVTKTYSLAAFFGSENVLEENIAVLGSKEQAEMTYHGIMCVEIADPDYEKTTGGKRFKANSTRRSFRGRFAYGRMEEMQTTRITYVVVMTGNNPKILYGNTGNRRVIPMHILGEIDTTLLLRLRDLILGYIADEAENAWFNCRKEMEKNGIEVEKMLPWDIKFKDIMLDEPELRAAAQALQEKALSDNLYEELVADAIFWDCVTVEPVGSGIAKANSATFHLSSDNIRQYLGLNVGYQWNSASKRIAEVLDGMVVLSKDEWKEQRQEWISVNNQVIAAHPDIAALQDLDKENHWLETHPQLSNDIAWAKKQVKRKRANFRGYRIDLDGPDWKNDYDILMKFREKIGTISKKSVGI